MRATPRGLFTSATVAVDSASGPDITAWVEVTPRGIRQHYTADGRSTDADYRANARRWWGREWGGLTRRERRRVLRRPMLLAMHRAWNRERTAQGAAVTLMMSGSELDTSSIRPLADILDRLRTRIHETVGVPMVSPIRTISHEEAETMYPRKQ